MLCSDLRASLSGKDIPEDIKARLLKLHEDNIQLQEQFKTAQEKLIKARQVSTNICPLLLFSTNLTQSPVYQAAGQTVQGRAGEERHFIRKQLILS